MNANELADQLDQQETIASMTTLRKIATMLRQLQAENTKLKLEWQYMYDRANMESTSEPVAWMDKDTLDATHIIKAVVRREQDEQHTIPLYTTPQKYCPSENNAAYEKGFIEGMAKQRDSKVQQFVEAYSSSLVEGTKLEAIRRTFGESSPKKEGESVSFDLADMNVTFPVRPEFQNPQTTYVERRVPIELEDEAHELIDNWLKSKGYGEDL